MKWTGRYLSIAGTSVCAKCMTDSPPCVHNDSHNVFSFSVSYVLMCRNPFVFTCGLRVEYVCVCDEERRLKGVLLAIALYFIFLDWFGVIMLQINIITSAYHSIVWGSGVLGSGLIWRTLFLFCTWHMFAEPCLVLRNPPLKCVCVIQI